MRKIIVSEFVSLDGMMSDPGDTMKWVTSIFNAKEGAYESDLYDRIGTLLLGRSTYDIWGAYWPKALSDPKSPKDEVDRLCAYHRVVEGTESGDEQGKIFRALRAIDAFLGSRHLALGSSACSRRICLRFGS